MTDNVLLKLLNEEDQFILNKKISEFLHNYQFNISNYKSIEQYTIKDVLILLKIDLMHESGIISIDERDLLSDYYIKYITYLAKKDYLEKEIVMNNTSKHGLNYASSNDKNGTVKIKETDCDLETFVTLSKYNSIILQIKTFLEVYGILEEFNIKDFINNYVCNKFDITSRKKILEDL